MVAEMGSDNSLRPVDDLSAALRAALKTPRFSAKVVVGKTTYRRSFTALTLIQWLIEENFCLDLDQAIKLGQAMMEKDLFYSVEGKTSFEHSGSLIFRTGRRKDGILNIRRGNASAQSKRNEDRMNALKKNREQMNTSPINSSNMPRCNSSSTCVSDGSFRRSEGSLATTAEDQEMFRLLSDMTEFESGRLIDVDNLQENDIDRIIAALVKCQETLFNPKAKGDKAKTTGASGERIASFFLKGRLCVNRFEAGIIGQELLQRGVLVHACSTPSGPSPGTIEFDSSSRITFFTLRHGEGDRATGRPQSSDQTSWGSRMQTKIAISASLLANRATDHFAVAENTKKHRSAFSVQDHLKRMQEAGLNNCQSSSGLPGPRGPENPVKFAETARVFCYDMEERIGEAVESNASVRDTHSKTYVDHYSVSAMTLLVSDDTYDECPSGRAIHGLQELG